MDADGQTPYLVPIYGLVTHRQKYQKRRKTRIPDGLAAKPEPRKPRERVSRPQDQTKGADFLISTKIVSANRT